MSVYVNGCEITDSAIAAEVQNHPAPDFRAAEHAAARALVVRELLRQEIERKALVAAPEELGDGRRETEEDALIRQLLEIEIELPTPDEAACRRFYDNNPDRFLSPDLYEAAHIFFPADPKDAGAYGEARRHAEETIGHLREAPKEFAKLAAKLSACSSAQDGGRLGQVTRGQTLPEFETFLDNLQPGQLCPVPVPTRYGYHVVRLDHKAAGRRLPFAAVSERIAQYLTDCARNRAISQYLHILAGRARIDGVEFEAADGPLVR